MRAEVKKQLEVLNQQVKELAAIYRQAAARQGVSDGEFWVWYALLVLGGEYSQQDICDIWSLPKQTIHSAVTNLARKGYVTLESDPAEGRRKVIRPTDTGRIYGRGVVQDICRAEEHALEHMDAGERAACIALLGKYIRLLKEKSDER